ncbi:isochorismatase family protein [Nocardioides alcanivorans]|uniref:isochorismatase family protein n=1 Tax=Nocardioides alcanivorans TaxID=2897352 RepID=UPI001F36524B|nr:isochorismatase family protein [Nocardioides alcanivorans]
MSSLPEGIDYLPPVPPHADLPTSRGTWTLEPGRAAVLVHDLQRYFARPYGEGESVLTDAVRRTAAVLTAARQAGIPVFYTAQKGNQDQTLRGLQRDLWGPGMQDIPEHTELLEAVRPLDGDVVLTKHRYNAFAGNDLGNELAARGRDQLVITGVYAHIGVTATALEAFQREVHPFVVADGIADFSAEKHALALQQIASCCGVLLMSDTVVASFAASAVEVPAARTPGDAAPWEVLLREELTTHLGADLAAQAFVAPETDLFELGLDSLRAFEVLDLLAEEGLDVDFGEFTRRPTVGHLRKQARELTSA